MILEGRKEQVGRGGHQQSVGLMCPMRGSIGSQDCSLPARAFNQVRSLMGMMMKILTVADWLWVLIFLSLEKGWTSPFFAM